MSGDWFWNLTSSHEEEEEEGLCHTSLCLLGRARCVFFLHFLPPVGFVAWSIIHYYAQGPRTVQVLGATNDTRHNNLCLLTDDTITLNYPCVFTAELNSSSIVCIFDSNLLYTKLIAAHGPPSISSQAPLCNAAVTSFSWRLFDGLTMGGGRKELSSYSFEMLVFYWVSILYMYL